MIELTNINKKDSSKENNEHDINQNNDQQKEIKKENRTLSQKKNKVDTKNQKQNNEININLSVGDINKMFLRHQIINNLKFNFFRFYISITLILTNTTFIFFFGLFTSNLPCK